MAACVDPLRSRGPSPPEQPLPHPDPEPLPGSDPDVIPEPKPNDDPKPDPDVFPGRQPVPIPAFGLATGCAASSILYTTTVVNSRNGVIMPNQNLARMKIAILAADGVGKAELAEPRKALEQARKVVLIANCFLRRLSQNQARLVGKLFLPTGKFFQQLARQRGLIFGQGTHGHSPWAEGQLARA